MLLNAWEGGIRLNKMGHQRLRQHTDHPDEEKVLLLLDGELNEREASAIGLHLEHCWECQTRVQRLKDGIYAFVEYREAACLPAVGTPPKGWSEFPDMLDRIANTNRGR